MDFQKQIFVLICFLTVDTKHKIIFDISFIYFLFHYLRLRKIKTKGAHSCLSSRDSLDYSCLFKGKFQIYSLSSVQNAFLFVYMYISKIKPINYLKIFMLTSPGFFFKEAHLFAQRRWSLVLAIGHFMDIDETFCLLQSVLRLTCLWIHNYVKSCFM